MDKNAHEISSGQVFIFIISAQISFGILRLAASLSKDVGHDGWISVLLAGLFVCVLIYLMILLLKRFKNLSILEINTFIFGKYIGALLNYLVIGYLLFTTSLSLRMFSDVIKLSALRNTPAVILTSFILIPTVYLSWYGLKYICRFSSIKPVLIVIVLMYYLLLSKYFRLTFLQPVGAAGMMKIIKGSYIPYVSYVGFEIVTIVYPYIKDKNSSMKYAVYGNLTTMLFYIITVVFLTGFFGEEMLKQLQYPIFSLARAFRAPVLERLDLFFIALWFPLMGTLVQLYYFCSYQCIKKLLNIENNKNKCMILISVVTVSVIALSRVPKDMIQVYKLFEILSYMGTAYICHIIICYIITFFKKPGGKKNEKAI
jgi:spore germination protein (amino acid permease)